VRVDAASAGAWSAVPNGGLVAPIEVRVTYARSGATQTRQSRISCQIDPNGQVIALR
jgi:hypothetical protein